MQCNTQEDNWVALSRKFVLFVYCPCAVMYFPCCNTVLRGLDSKIMASFMWKPAPIATVRLKQRLSFSEVRISSITVKLVLVYM